jgi:hypothetical protein
MMRSTPGREPVVVDGALEERGLDGGALDALADVAHEQVDQRLRQPG